jgi:TolB protein
MMQLKGAVAAGALLCACSTEPNPNYCDETRPCAVGMCDLTTNRCVPTPDTAPAPVDADTEMCERAGGRLIWVSDRDGDSEIVTAFADGSGFRALTDNVFPDEEPRVSPDGTKIAWLSSPSGVAELYVMDVDGASPLNLSSQGEGALLARDPTWSTNGRLAFMSERDGQQDIYVVSADGSGFAAISHNGGASKPTWAPGADDIAYQRIVEGNNDIYRAGGTGGGGITTRLTNQPDFDGVPKWSPEGSTIAYVSEQPSYREIWSMTVTGASEAVLVPATPTHILDFEWSVDGEQIVFEWSGEIEVVDADGSNRINLTDDGYSDNDPSWSPDGDHIVFMSTRDGNEEIYAMMSNGLEITNVSNDAGEDSDPSWFGCT